MRVRFNVVTFEALPAPHRFMALAAVGAARRHRLRSLFSVARLITQNSDPAPAATSLSTDDTLRKVIGKCRRKASTGESASIGS